MVNQIINNSKKLFDWIKGFIYIFKFDLMTLFFIFIIIITPFYPESLKSFLLQNKATIGSVFQLAGVVFVLIGVYFASVKEYLIEKKKSLVRYLKKFPFLKGKDVEVKATASGSSFATIKGSVETKGIKVNSLEERVNILEENYNNLNKKINKIKNSFNERIDNIQTQSKNDKEELNEKIVDIEKEQIKINQKNKSNHVFEFIGSLSIITGLILDLISKNMLINYLF